MRKVCVGVMALALVGCGGGGGGTGGGSGTVTTPAPSPTPSPSPTPAPTYARFADLTGNQDFRTACAALDFTGTPPVPTPATGYGDGLRLAYVAATQSYSISGDGLALGFGPVDRDPAAPAGVEAYLRTPNGQIERLNLGVPLAGGTGLDYARGFVLSTRRPTQTSVLYRCILGVPTLASDLPATALPYTRFGLNGTAYVGGPGTGLRTYAVDRSVVSLALDPVAQRVTVSIRLVGALLGPDGPSTTVIELGNFTGTTTIDRVRQSYGGPLTSSDRTDVFASFGGWFFGPQAREAGAAVSIFTADPSASPSRIAFVGNLTAAR